MAATQLDVISQLAQLLGGSRTTGTADTTALRQVLSQLQQLNSPEGQAAQTQALFQQAAGQIPGLQGAYSNAVGARRGGNSAVQGALNKLLTQTTLAGQAQQNANLQAQAQAAAALANATRGTTTKTNLGGAAGNMLLLQGFAKGKKLFGDLFDDSTGAVTPGQVSPSADMSLTNPVAQGNGIEFNSVPGASFDINNLLGGAPTFDLGLGGDAFQSANTDLSGANFGGGGLLDELAGMGVFADGGLVGRDGQAPRGGDEETGEEFAQVKFDRGFTPNATLDVLRALMPAFADGGLIGRGGQQANVVDEETTEANTQARFDPGFTNNVALDLLRAMMPAFADGGSVNVQAAGGRRTGSQTVTPTAPVRMAATTTTEPPEATDPGGISLSSIFGSGGEGPTRSNIADPTNGAFGAAIQDNIGPAGKLNTISGAIGGPTIPGFGTVGGLLGADTNDQAVRALGITALGAINPVLALIANIALPKPDLSERQAVNSLNESNPAPAYDPATAPTDANIDTTGVDPTDFTIDFGGGSGGGYGRGGAFGTNNSAGDSGMGGDSVGGFGGTRNAANGGKIRGPGTGTSDSIPAMLSNGEYVISKDVVDAVGVDFFDALQKSLHTPVATRRS